MLVASPSPTLGWELNEANRVHTFWTYAGATYTSDT